MQTIEFQNKSITLLCIDDLELIRLIKFNFISNEFGYYDKKLDHYAVDFAFSDMLENRQMQDMFLNKSGIIISEISELDRKKFVERTYKLLCILHHNYYMFKRKSSYEGISNVPLKYFEYKGFNDNNPSTRK